jgi:hypothetical protein
MAIYRFRVTFEDYDEVTREIDILSKQTFLDLHRAIHNSTGYPTEVSSSFYVSNDQWKKGHEIAYLPSPRKAAQDISDMEVAKLSRFIDDPHQKFYYIYNFDRPFDFHVQLIKILKEEEGKTYPLLFKSIGQAPKLPGTALLNLGGDQKDSDDYDFLNETEYGIDEAEDFDLLDEEEEENGEGGDDAAESENFDEY